MDVARFRRLPLMAILRGVSSDRLEPLLEAILAGGLETVEITMNTPGAAGLIARAVRVCGRSAMVGAGTVLDVGSLKSALDAGASFIVMPVVVKEVVLECVRQKIPVFPGALCPQEIFEAWSLGATMVKVFPSRLFGPEYFRELKGPFDSIELMACSGVRPGNLKAYFDCGASAAAIGSGVFRQDLVEAGKFDRIASSVRGYLRVYSAISSGKKPSSTSNRRKSPKTSAGTARRLTR